MAEINTENRSGDVELDLAVVFGNAQISIERLLNWSEGSLLELDKLAGEGVDVEVNGTPFAKGEVVTIAENFGVRLTEIFSD